MPLIPEAFSVFISLIAILTPLFVKHDIQSVHDIILMEPIYKRYRQWQTDFGRDLWNVQSNVSMSSIFDQSEPVFRP